MAKTIEIPVTVTDGQAAPRTIEVMVTSVKTAPRTITVPVTTVPLIQENK